MQKISYAKMEQMFRDYNSTHDENKATLSAVVVFKQEQKGWNRNDYTLEQRSYRVWNNNRAFQEGKCANSVFGDCLDGTDLGIRLDWYHWDVDYCYMEGSE